MLELAQQRAQRRKLKTIEFLPGRLEDLPLERESVDLVRAILVLHHAADLRDSIREIRRVTRAGGKALIVDFEPHQMEEFQLKMGDPNAGVDPGEVVREMEGAGFDIDLKRPLRRSSEGELNGPPRAAPNLYLIRATNSKLQKLEKLPSRRRAEKTHSN